MPRVLPARQMRCERKRPTATGSDRTTVGPGESATGTAGSCILFWIVEPRSFKIPCMTEAEFVSFFSSHPFLYGSSRPSRDRIKSHSLSETGMIESRFPLRTKGIFLSSTCALSSDSGMTRCVWRI